ncbi:MAG: glycosyltransferase family 4 protein [Paludibacter sp.]|nr:glycosyltransferase family 4 protein [Paludibacter sp.]
MIYIVLLILLFAAELAYFRIADHFNIIDKPNERSSHSKITLRGGGVIFYIGILIYFALEGFQYPWFFSGLTLISMISFADDIQPQSNKLRLVIHFISMALMFYEWNLFSLPWYYTLISLIICTGILNAYNFMDGINGITGGYSLVIAGALWYINSYQIQFIDNQLLIILILSLLVFNFFNFRKKAKCFAGDVGSISLAFIVVFLLGKLIIKTGDISYIILLAVYGVDTVLTIIHRLILKENIFKPHRKHVFQIMANELKIPHTLVSLLYAFLQGLIILGLFLFKTNSIIYMIAVIILLSISYIIFNKKYFKLHTL